MSAGDVGGSAGAGGAGGVGEAGAGDVSADVQGESRVGRRAGLALGVAAVAGLAVLAGFGFKPALYLLVLAVVGTLMVVVGARLH